MNVDAVVVAGGRRGGVDAARARSAAVPMVVRAVRGLLDSGLVEHVVVLDARSARVARRACAGLPVSVHAAIAAALVRVGTRRSTSGYRAR